MILRSFSLSGVMASYSNNQFRIFGCLFLETLKMTYARDVFFCLLFVCLVSLFLSPVYFISTSNFLKAFNLFLSVHHTHNFFYEWFFCISKVLDITGQAFVQTTTITTVLPIFTCTFKSLNFQFTLLHFFS